VVIKLQNGWVIDGSKDPRRATDEEVARVNEWQKGMQQWGNDLNRAMQERAANMFPPGFPFNNNDGQPQQKANFQAPPTPEFPCLCASCSQTNGMMV